MNMRTPPSLIEDDMPEETSLNHEPPVDFSEYMWMADELEEFDKQVLEELREEAFIEACFEEMLAEEEAQWCIFSYSQDNIHEPSDMGLMNEIVRCFHVQLQESIEELVNFSNLNPEAPEFFPRSLHT